MFEIIKEYKIAYLDASTIPDDVIERLDQLHFYEAIDYDFPVIYSVSDIKSRILEDEEDDTNETTKTRIEKLINKLKENNFNYFQFN